MTRLHLPGSLAKGEFETPIAEARALPLAVQRAGDERLFTLLLLLSYPFFLVLAASARLMQGGGEGDKRSSVFQVAAEAARSTIAIAFNQ